MNKLTFLVLFVCSSSYAKPFIADCEALDLGIRAPGIHLEIGADSKIYYATSDGNLSEILSNPLYGTVGWSASTFGPKNLIIVSDSRVEFEQSLLATDGKTTNYGKLRCVSGCHII